MQIREYTEDDFDAVVRIRKLAFGPNDPPERIVVPGRRGLLAEIDGQVAGVLGIGEYWQYFGGRTVPMGGIGGVAVAPHARGRGVASALLDTALRTMREHGQSTSVLYATVPGLYRARGWERAGVYERMYLPMDRLLMSPRGTRRLSTRRVTEADLEDLHACYLAVASTVDGLLDRRSPKFTVADVLDDDIVTVAHDENGALRGYLTADREKDRLKVHDVIGLDLDAQLTLLRELTSWAGVLDVVAVRIADPSLTGLITSHAMRHHLKVSEWLMRVVDLPAAVAARGWPNAAALRTSSVDLEIVDEHAPWHAGRQRLVVDGGRVWIEPGGTGEVRLHARALGPWFTGMQNTPALRRAGLLDGAAPLLDQLTGTPGTPRLADFF